MSIFGTPVAVTVGQSSTASSCSVTTNTALGDLIVVTVINFGASASGAGITDTIGNTYVFGYSTGDANGTHQRTYYCLGSIGANASNVVTWTPATTSATTLIVVNTPASGIVALDTKDHNGSDAFTSPTITTASYSTTGADEIVFGTSECSSPTTGNYQASSGYTLAAGSPITGETSAMCGAVEYQKFSSPQTGITTSITNTGAANMVGTVAVLAFKGGDVNVSHNADASVSTAGTSKTHNVDASVLVSTLTNKSYSVDAYVTIVQISHSIDAQVQVGNITVVVNSVNLAGTILPKLNPANIIKLRGTLGTPGRQYVQLAATLKSPNNLSFVNLAGVILVGTRNYIKFAGTFQNPTYRIHNVDANVTSGAQRGFIKLACTLKQPLVIGPGGFPSNSWIKLAATLVVPGGSIQMPGSGTGTAGFTAADDWNSSQDALTSYKPTSIFNISGGTLPTGGINLIVTAFTCGVVSSQTRTRSWLRLVDAAPSGIVITTAVATHTLPNGAVITTTTTTEQNQDSTTVTTVIQNSATPQRTSTIQTIKFNSGQTVTTETDQNNTNGEITTTKKKSVTSAPPIAENIQPLQVRTLDGIIHYQFFTNVNPDWAGGEQQGLTSSSSAVTITGDKRVTIEDVTEPSGKNIHTVTEEVIPTRDIGTVLTSTTESFAGSTKTTTTTTTYPDGTQTISTKITQPSGDSVENTTENVVDEYGQLTTTVTKTETVVSPQNTIITKTVNVTKGGVTTTDTIVTTNNNFEDSIVSTKVKVYFLQEFTITCVIDEQAMTALQGINITHQKNYALMELFGQQLGNTQLSWILRQSLIEQFTLANNSIIPVTLQALGNLYSVVFAQAASGFRAKYIPGTEPHVYELQMILQTRSDVVNGTFGF
jgi:hypothetical protein